MRLETTLLFKKISDVGLELGGKDAAYICKDVDIASAAAGAIDGAFYNAGQSCCAVERIYVHHSVYDNFIEEALKLVKSYKMGDPMKEETNLGPMAQPKAPAFLLQQVDQARSIGAKILCGGSPCSDADGKVCKYAFSLGWRIPSWVLGKVFRTDISSRLYP
jgi:acyl-CoA reductase-like NAD-dependent aldehyde dehydrogenase